MQNNNEFEGMQYYNDSFSQTTSRSGYSCCIAMTSLIFGYMLIIGTESVINNPRQNRYRPYYRQCDVTLPYCYYCGLCFVMAGCIRIIYMLTYVIVYEKYQYLVEMWHNRLKSIEIMAASLFFMMGSGIMMIKENCYELNLIFLFVMVLNVFVMIWVCCDDFDPEDILQESIIDG